MAYMDFDKVLEKVGGFGLFQKYYIVLLGLSGIPMGAMTLANVFIAGLPQFWCLVPELSNLTQEQQQEISAPWKTQNDGDIVRDSCHIYDIDYGSLDLSAGNYSQFAHQNNVNTSLKRCTEWMYSDAVFYYTTVTRWNLVCGSLWKKSFSQSSYMLGFLLGAVIFGCIADRIGRKLAFLIAISMFVTSGIAAAFMPDYFSHIIVRLITASSGAGFFTIAFVIQMEVIGTAHRMIPGVLFQGWFAAGYMLAALMAYFLRDYRYLQVIIASSAALLFSYYWLLGESPRWLLSQKRFVQCEQEVAKMVKMNKTSFPTQALERQTSIASEYGGSKECIRRHTVLDLVKTPNMRLKSLNIFYNWYVNSFVYYGLTLAMSDLAGGPYFNIFISGVMEFVGYLPAIFLLDKIGRRLPLSLMLIVAGISCLIIAGIPKHYGILTTVLAMIGKLSISGSFAVIYVYSAELFPTVIRTTGVGAGSMSARIGGLLAPFVADLIRVWRPLPFIIFGTTTLVAGFLTMLLPETLYRHLPETIEDGENFRMGKFHFCAEKPLEDADSDENFTPMIYGNKPV